MKLSKAFNFIFVIILFLAVIVIIAPKKPREIMRIKLSKDFYIGNSTAIGIYSESFETLIAAVDSCDFLKFPCAITIKAEDTGDEKTMTIKSRKDIPRHSIQVECPKSKYSGKNSKCWFIKYNKE